MEWLTHVLLSKGKRRVIAWQGTRLYGYVLWPFYHIPDHWRCQKGGMFNCSYMCPLNICTVSSKNLMLRRNCFQQLPVIDVIGGVYAVNRILWRYVGAGAHNTQQYSCLLFRCRKLFRQPDNKVALKLRWSWRRVFRGLLLVNDPIWICHWSSYIHTSLHLSNRNEMGEEIQYNNTYAVMR